jgi:hypothetical protein
VFEDRRVKLESRDLTTVKAAQVLRATGGRQDFRALQIEDFYLDWQA